MPDLSSISRVALDGSKNSADRGTSASIAEIAAAITSLIVKINPPVTPIENVEGTATQLDYGITPVIEGAENMYALQLPLAVAGKWCLLYAHTNIGSNPFAVWPKFDGDDTINGVSADPVVSATGTQVIQIFTCNTDGDWIANGFLD